MVVCVFCLVIAWFIVCYYCVCFERFLSLFNAHWFGRSFCYQGFDMEENGFVQFVCFPFTFWHLLKCVYFPREEATSWASAFEAHLPKTLFSKSCFEKGPQENTEIVAAFVEGKRKMHLKRLLLDMSVEQAGPVPWRRQAIGACSLHTGKAGFTPGRGGAWTARDHTCAVTLALATARFQEVSSCCVLMSKLQLQGAHWAIQQSHAIHRVWPLKHVIYIAFHLLNTTHTSKANSKHEGLPSFSWIQLGTIPWPLAWQRYFKLVHLTHLLPPLNHWVAPSSLLFAHHSNHNTLHPPNLLPLSPHTKRPRDQDNSLLLAWMCLTDWPSKARRTERAERSLDGRHIELEIALSFLWRCALDS